MDILATSPVARFEFSDMCFWHLCPLPTSPAAQGVIRRVDGLRLAKAEADRSNPGGASN